MNHLLAFHTESYVYVFGVWIECVCMCDFHIMFG